MKESNLIKDLKLFYYDIKAQDFAFWMACGYLIFSFLRPQALYPAIDFLPWTQLCILLGIGYQITKGQFQIEFGHFLMILFCTAVVISCFNSYYPEQSFDKIDVIFIWLAEVIFFTNCVKSPYKFKLAVGLLFLVLFKMSSFGARTWISRGFGFRDWGIAGPTGFFANSGEFSLLMAMFAVLAIGFFAGLRQKRWYYHLFSITAVMTVVGASSRGGQLALLVGLLFIALAFKKVAFKHLLIGSLIATLTYHLIPAQQMERFSTMGSDDTSTARLDYWKAGLEMMNDNKFTGTGYTTFPQYYYEHYARYKRQDDVAINRREVSHNSFIEVGSGLGYTGLIIYCWILFYTYYLCSNIKKLIPPDDEENKWLLTTAIGMKAAMIVYLIGSFFMSVAFYPYVYLMLMLAMVMRSSAKQIDSSNQKSTVKDKGLKIA